MKMLKILLVAALGVAPLLAAGQIAFTGTDREPMEVTPETNTGLTKIYVLHSAEGVGMTYRATTMNPVTWFVYGEGGGGYAQELLNVVDDPSDPLVSSIAEVEPERGYIIEEGTTRSYVWVTDYSRYPLHLSTIEADADGDCNTVTLHVDGSGTDIHYYTITGARKTLSRDLKLTYNNLTMQDSSEYVQEVVEDLQEGFKPTIVMPAPLCDTDFTLSGDRFMDYWGEGQLIGSDMWHTQAVEVNTTAVQASRDYKNEKKTQGVELGGSAPCEITFTSFCSDAVVHKEWQMASDEDFNNIMLRLNQDVVEETFNEAGTFYWRFIGSNADGSCESQSQVYKVTIGESELKCPNVFTPGTSEGVNDIWCVSYKSITEFHCVIFNRWGNKMIELNHPSEGWDGTYRGKQVPAGVYYYVIKAVGSDGQRYNLTGDINIIRYHRVDRGGGDDTGTTVVDPEP